jgi:hypothetical protein
MNAALDAASQPLIAYLDDDNEMWPHWVAAVAEFFEQHPSVQAVYGAQLRFDLAAPSGVLFSPEHDYEALRRANYIDTGSLAHRATPLRWTAGTQRFNDWEFALNLFKDQAVRPLPRVASLYDVSQPDRLSDGRNWRLLRDAVVEKHGRPESEQFVCALCRFTASDRPEQNVDVECPNCQSLSHHRLLAVLLPLLAEPLLIAGGTVLGISPFPSAEVLLRHHGLTLIELESQPVGAPPRMAVVGRPEELPVRSSSVSAVLLPDDWLGTDLSAVVRQVSRVTATKGVVLIPVSAARSHGTPSDGAEPRVDSGMSAHRALARHLMPQQLLATYAIRPGAEYLLCHPEAECGPDCWIQAVIDDQVSLTEQLAVYLHGAERSR